LLTKDIVVATRQTGYEHEEIQTNHTGEDAVQHIVFLILIQPAAGGLST
jgi:hypothetical protein